MGEWLFWVSVIAVGLTLHSLLSGFLTGVVRIYTFKRMKKKQAGWMDRMTEAMEEDISSSGTDARGYM